MSDCLFCKIVKGDIPSTKVFENSSVYAFQDLHPQAKEHLLFVHKEHTCDVNDMSENKPVHFSDVFLAIRDYTTEKNIDKKGFRVVSNLGSDAGQTVFHTHFHVLFGEKLGRFGS